MSSMFDFFLTQMHISHLLFSYRLGVSGPAQSYFVRQFRGGLLAQLSICCTKAFSEIKLLFVTPYGVVIPPRDNLLPE